MSLMLRPLARYADFKGRASRSEYWLFWLFQLIVLFVLALILIMSLTSGKPAVMGIGLLVSGAGIGLFTLGCLIPQYAVTVRRLHDTNRSALWLLLYLPGFVAGGTAFVSLSAFMASGQQGAPDYSLLAPLLSGSPILSLINMGCQITLLVFMCLPGTTGANRFGPDPKGGHIDVSVFDDTRVEEAIARAKAEANLDQPPHKPIFDFGPSSTGPMIAANAHQSGQALTPAAPTASPSSAGWAPAYDPGIRPSKPFGRRT